MEYTLVVFLSLLAAAAAIGENKAIRVENIQDVCAAISGVSQHIETGLPGSECVYLVNAPNACKNCLDLNCSLAISYSFFRIALTSEFSVLPCHDGSLDIPRHAIGSRILDENGKLLFRRRSSQSFDDSFEIEIPTFFLSFSVTVKVSATIENRGNGVFIQVDATVYGSPFEVFPPTFIPITCSEVDKPVCFGRISDETSTSTARASESTPTSTGTGTPTSTEAGAPLSMIVGTLTPTSAGTPTLISSSAGTLISTSAGTLTPTSAGAPTLISSSAGTLISTSAGTLTPTSARAPTLMSSSASTLISTSAGTPTPTSQNTGTIEPTLDNAGVPMLAAAVWTILLLALISLASLCY